MWPFLNALDPSSGHLSMSNSWFQFGELFPPVITLLPLLFLHSLFVSGQNRNRSKWTAKKRAIGEVENNFDISAGNIAFYTLVVNQACL